MQQQGRKRKSVINKDHLDIAIDLESLNAAQDQFITSFKNGFNILAKGSAGSGKTFLACYLALDELFSGRAKKIVIVRSAVSVRNQGFLPGSLKEKEEPLTIPFKALINFICQNGTAWDILLRKNMVEFISTSYIRGITLDDTIVIFEEIQNCNWEETTSVLSRLGENSRIIMCGDTKQNDLIYQKNDQSGLGNLIRVVDRMSSFFDVVNFTSADIVRSGFTKAFIIACEELNL